ncbi:MAG: FAD-binding protein [Magnetococcus sp. DMHC-6]
MTTNPPRLHDLPLAFVQGAEKILPGGFFYSQTAHLAQLECYAWDNTDMRCLPQAVALVQEAGQVAALLKWCHEWGICVTPRGAGTGNVGGALAVQGGVVLSLQRMNRLLEINPADRLAVVEPGIVNADLQARLRPHGLFWPPDPSSARSCTIGGNLAMCAAGPHAVRYGVTRDWVLGVHAVLADGTLLQTGGRTTKGVVGYDLTRLLIGSEGSLAVITQATLKLAVLPTTRRLMRVVFAHVDGAAQAIAALMVGETLPCAVEFLDPAALNLLRATVKIPDAGRAMLLLELCGGVEDVERQMQGATAVVSAFDPLELVVAAGEGDQANQVWAARFALSPLLKKLAPKRVNEDVVVPISRLAELIYGLEQLAMEQGVPIVTFGHAGNGNMHVNLLLDPTDPAQTAKVEETLARLFRLVLSLEGTLSGEHGIGTQKKPFIHWELSPSVLKLHHGIKTLFDPKGILNPGKIF